MLSAVMTLVNRSPYVVSGLNSSHGSCVLSMAEPMTFTVSVVLTDVGLFATKEGDRNLDYLHRRFINQLQMA